MEGRGGEGKGRENNLSYLAHEGREGEEFIIKITVMQGYFCLKFISPPNSPTFGGNKKLRLEEFCSPPFPSPPHLKFEPNKINF